MTKKKFKFLVQFSFLFIFFFILSCLFHICPAFIRFLLFLGFCCFLFLTCYMHFLHMCPWDPTLVQDCGLGLGLKLCNTALYKYPFSFGVIISYFADFCHL